MNKIKKLSNQGFSLIEIVIAVAILTIVAAMMATCLTTSSKSSLKSMDNRKAREDVVGTLDAKVIGGVDIGVETPDSKFILKKGGADFKTFKGVVDNSTGYSAASFRSHDSESDPMPGADEAVPVVPPEGGTESSTEPTTSYNPGNLEDSADITGWEDIKEPVNLWQGKDANIYHITDNAVFLDPISFQESDCIYIDTVTNNKNIDIVFTQPIEMSQQRQGIYVNDNNGQNRVRIFLAEDGDLSLTSGAGNDWGFYPVADGTAGATFSVMDCARSDGNVSSKVDIKKKLNMYLIATGEQTIRIGGTAYIPGYVISPYATFETAGMNHEYKKTEHPTFDKDNPDFTTSDYPCVNGMIVCKEFIPSQTMNDGYLVTYNPPDKTEYMKALADCFVYE